MGEGSISQEEIESLLSGGLGEEGAEEQEEKAPKKGEGEDVLAGLDPSLSSELAATLSSTEPSIPTASPPPSPKKQQPVSLGSDDTENIDLLLDVNVTLSVILGSTMMYVKDLTELTEGMVIELDRNAGEPVDVLINGKPFAKAKLVAVNEFYGIEILEFIQSPLASLGMES